MVLRRFERGLERLVDGVFASAFRTGLRPVELGRRLTRELDAGATIGLDGRRVAPNHFSVRLSPTDHAEVEGIRTSLERELAEVARQRARSEGLGFMGPVRVELVADPDRKPGRFDVDTELREPPGGAGFGTLVNEEGARMELPAATGALVIGRLPECDVQLHDPNVSRRHAELRPIEGGWLVADLGSMNGTRIDGKKVSEHRLIDGDVIVIGTHTLRYEAN